MESDRGRMLTVVLYSNVYMSIYHIWLYHTGPYYIMLYIYMFNCIYVFNMI